MDLATIIGIIAGAGFITIAILMGGSFRNLLMDHLC